MSALARYFVQKGYRVLGYDRTPSSLTKALEAEGIVIRYDEDICGLETLDKKHTLVIRTPAVPEMNSFIPIFVSEALKYKNVLRS